jgi:Integrase core domain
MELADHATAVKFLVRDRDTKYTASFDAVFAADAVRVITTPVQGPRANAICERVIDTIRRECLDRMIILGRRHLETVLAEYVEHYNAHRPHRSLDQRAPSNARCDSCADRRCRTRPATTNRPLRRPHPRVPDRRVSWVDGVLGTHRFLLQDVIHGDTPVSP